MFSFSQFLLFKLATCISFLEIPSVHAFMCSESVRHACLIGLTLNPYALDSLLITASPLESVLILRLKVSKLGSAVNALRQLWADEWGLSPPFTYTFLDRHTK